MTNLREMIKSVEALEKNGEYEDALKVLEQVINYFKNNNKYKEKYFEARKIECEAKKLKGEGKFKEAADKIIEAAKIWELLNKEKERTWCLANHYSWYGGYYFHQKNYQSALQQYSEAKKHFEKLKDFKNSKYCEANISNIRALLEKKKNKLDIASNLFFQSSEIFRELGLLYPSIFAEINAWGTLGQLELRSGSYEEAKFLFKVAVKLSEAINREDEKNWFAAKYLECEYRLLKKE